MAAGRPLLGLSGLHALRLSPLGQQALGEDEGGEERIGDGHGPHVTPHETWLRHGAGSAAAESVRGDR
jgi:hypothetical protein